jgi:hypothetical protein
MEAQGRLFVSFLVLKNGSISNIDVEKSFTMRVTRKQKERSPQCRNGSRERWVVKKVNVKMYFPFALSYISISTERLFFPEYSGRGMG